jgi:hypothetical protein
MSSELRKELNSRLSILHGAGQVYYDTAVDASFPYDVFTINPSGPSEYHGADHHVGTITIQNVLIETYATTATAAESRLRAIIRDLESTPLSLETDQFIQLQTVTQSLQQDPIQAEDGENIWRGDVIFEMWIGTGR